MKDVRATSVETAAEQRALIALSLVPGVGPGRIRALLARFGTAEGVLGASRRALAGVPGVGPRTAAAITSFDDYELVDEQLRRAEQQGITLVGLRDPCFPALLKQIFDPPAFLWVAGSLEPHDERAIAIVGTRRASEYGRHLAHRFAYELAQRGFTIVSGLAYGIDAAAHKGALEASGRTIAILGSGVDNIYPARHKGLAREITRNGAVVSEYPLGAAPDAPNFPRRNRLISGMTLGTLVVEAYEKGGALITARLAVEQNREVYAIPSPVQSASGAGANRLIQRGHARLVMTVDDVLEDLGLQAAVETAGEAAAPPVPEVQLSSIERRLLDAVEATPQHIDEVCARTGFDSATALVYLLSLEFKGLVRQMAGKQFYRDHTI